MRAVIIHPSRLTPSGTTNTASGWRATTRRRRRSRPPSTSR